MALGAEAVFVGSGIFLSADPVKRARAIVDATTYWQEPKKLAEISANLGSAMPGLEMAQLTGDARLAARGW
jgi:pyridoxal 5'-phosphate synthase pdxS subunit